MAKRLLPRGKAKPKGPLTLNRGNRFATRAIAYPFINAFTAPLGEPDLVYDVGGTLAFTSGVNGTPGLKFNTTSDWIRLPNDARLNTTSLTQLVIFRYDAVSGLGPSNTLSTSHRTTSSTDALQFTVQSSSGQLVVNRDNTSEIGRSPAGSPTYQLGTIGVAAMSYDGSNLFLGLNGYDVTGTTSSNTFTRAGMQLLTKAQNGSETPRPDELFLYVYWPYAMSRADLAELTRDPWQIFNTGGRSLPSFDTTPITDATVTNNQVTSTDSTVQLGTNAPVTSNQVTSANAAVTISIDTTASGSQVTSTAATAAVSTIATSTANQVTSTDSTVQLGTDAAVTSNQVTSTDSQAGAGTAVTSNQVTSASAAAAISIDATSSAGQVTSTNSAVTVSIDATSAANQVTSTNSAVTISVDTSCSANQVTSASAAAAFDVQATVTSTQVTSTESVLVVSIDATVSGGIVTSASASAAVILDGAVAQTQVTSTDSSIEIGHRVTVHVNQVTTSVSAIAKTGSTVRSPEKWRALAVSEDDQVLVIRQSTTV